MRAIWFVVTVCLAFSSIAEASGDSVPNTLESVFNKAANTLSSVSFMSESSLDALSKSWGGGAVKSFTSKQYGRSVKVVLRSQTSGIPSTEVFFFSDGRKKMPGWQLVLHYPLVAFEALDVEEKADGISLFVKRHEDGFKLERLFVPYSTLVGPVVADRKSYPLQLERNKDSRP